jgi:hypothetical protein
MGCIDRFEMIYEPVSRVVNNQKLPNICLSLLDKSKSKQTNISPKVEQANPSKYVNDQPNI